jgi:amidase
VTRPYSDSPELFANAPVGLQLLGRRFQEEAVLGMTEVVAEALRAQRETRAY